MKLHRMGALATALVVFAWVAPSSAKTYVPDGDLIGEPQIYPARSGDTYEEIARTHDVGFVELIVANQDVEHWAQTSYAPILVPGQHVLPDAPRRGIVINLPDMRLYYFREGEVVTFPIGVGMEGWETPLGNASIVEKRTNPTWNVPISIQREQPELPASVPPGPDNPLGDYAMRLSWRSILVHGTNQPASVGRRVSHGCIRLYPEDIEALYQMVPVGTPVAVVNQPVKVGWSRNNLWMEVSPSLAQADEFEFNDRMTPEPLPNLQDKVLAAAGDQAHRIDWDAVAKAAEARTGVPVRITQDPAVAEDPRRLEAPSLARARGLGWKPGASVVVAPTPAVPPQASMVPVQQRADAGSGLSIPGYYGSR